MYIRQHILSSFTAAVVPPHLEPKHIFLLTQYFPLKIQSNLTTTDFFLSINGEVILSTVLSYFSNSSGFGIPGLLVFIFLHSDLLYTSRCYNTFLPYTWMLKLALWFKMINYIHLTVNISALAFFVLAHYMDH